MRRARFLFAAATILKGSTETAVTAQWAELKAKRDRLTSFHQEFEVTSKSNSTHGTQATQRRVVLDVAGAKWRARLTSGSGKHTRIFDGEQICWMEDGGNEYVSTKPRSKDPDPLPPPYEVANADWGSATEVERRGCGLSQAESQCILLKVPLTPSQRLGSNGGLTRVTGGTALILIELGTGLIVSSRTVESVETSRLNYQTDISYRMTTMKFGGPAQAALFALPSTDMRKVKELSPWNAAKIRKQLAGEPAPELEVTDLAGKHLTLSALKGKTVLLDFWTTWCPPCRRDAPALDKLYGKYGANDLMIVSISVSEERAVVEKYLAEHPREFPVVLTTENELPRPYQIAAFPTYIVIDRQGTVLSAEEGDQGFAELRKLLKKAGVEAE